MSGSDKKGDQFYLEGATKKVLVEVVNVSEDGYANKVKAVYPTPELGKIGFFLEGEDFVAFDLDILKLHN